jgi:hypothetical protein
LQPAVEEPDQTQADLQTPAGDPKPQGSSDPRTVTTARRRRAVVVFVIA